MPPCIAFGCTNRSSNKSKEQLALESSGIKITFHRLPGNEQRRDAWIKAIRRSNWSPSESSRICSCHFKETDFDKSSLSYIRLKDFAIPSIFPVFPYLQKDQKPKRSLKRNQEAEIIIPPIPKQTTSLLTSDEALSELLIQPPVAPNTNQQIQKVGDRSTSISPNKKRFLESQRKKIMREGYSRRLRNYQIKINNLQEVKRRQEKTIANLKSVLNELETNFIRS